MDISNFVSNTTPKKIGLFIEVRKPHQAKLSHRRPNPDLFQGDCSWANDSSLAKLR